MTKVLYYPFQGLPPAPSLTQSILLAQVTILRRLDEIRAERERLAA
jgi:hypothetical protein